MSKTYKGREEQVGGGQLVTSWSQTVSGTQSVGLGGIDSSAHMKHLSCLPPQWVIGGDPGVTPLPRQSYSCQLEEILWRRRKHKLVAPKTLKHQVDGVVAPVKGAWGGPR